MVKSKKTRLGAAKSSHTLRRCKHLAAGEGVKVSLRRKGYFDCSPHPRGRLVDDLVNIAMSVCHHDGADDDPATEYEREQLRRKFGHRLVSNRRQR